MEQNVYLQTIDYVSALWFMMMEAANLCKLGVVCPTRIITLSVLEFLVTLKCIMLKFD